MHGVRFAARDGRSECLQIVFAGEVDEPGGMLREVAAATGRRIVFFCAFGERSAMAVAAAKEAGLANTAHIAGGMDAWKKAGGPVATG